jgi:sec-independent protein translocase protein TatA
MFHISTPELMIVLVIVVLIFGVGRIGKVAGELGKGIREFQRGIKGDEAAAADTGEKKG